MCVLFSSSYFSFHFIIISVFTSFQRLEPSAPPLSDLDVDNANMNELNKSSGSPKRRPDILMNIPSHGDGEKCRDKLIPAKNKLTTEPQG